MTSFFAKSIGYISRQPETVSAILATSRSLMNCSIVPVLLSDDELWDSLCRGLLGKKKQENLLRLFSFFSDTMQFTEKLTFPVKIDSDLASDILKNLIENKRYFCRTLQHITFPSLESIELCCGKLLNIRTIDVSKYCRANDDSSGDLQDKHLDLICSTLPGLESLDLSYQFELTDAAFDEKVSKLKFLKELNLEHYFPAINARVLTEMKGLRKLNVGYTSNLKEDAFAAATTPKEGNAASALLSVFLPNLTELDAQSCGGITDAMYQNLPRLAPNLTSLTVGVIGEDGIKGIAMMQNLRTLRLRDCSEFQETDAEVLFSSSGLQNLEVLEICECGYLGDEIILSISQTKSPIRRFKVWASSVAFDESFRHLTALKHLEVLDLAYAQEPTGNIGGDDENDNNNNNNQFSSALKEIRLAWCQKVSCEGLLSLMTPNLSLRKLDLSGNCEVTADCLKRVFTNSTNSRQSLEELNLASMKKLQDFSFFEGGGFDSLKKLDLEYSRLDFDLMRQENNKDTTKGFGALPVTIEELSLCNTKVEDCDLAALPPKLIRNLRSLDITYCENLTDDSFHNTISNMISLESLIILGSGSKWKKSISARAVADCAGDKLLNLKNLGASDEVKAVLVGDPVLLRKCEYFS